MSNLSTTFSALGDASRFAIVERLLTEGELSAGQLNQSAKVSAPAVSRHLKILRQSGIVHQRIEKQKRIYSVRPEAVRSIEAWTMSHRAFWEKSLDRLEAALEQEGLQK